MANISAAVDASNQSPSGALVYTALLTQTSTNAPTATELENTFQITPTFAYSDVGVYTITMTGQFTENKTVIIIYNETTLTHGGSASFTASRTDADSIRINSYGDKYSTLSNGELAGTPIGIIVYQ